MVDDVVDALRRGGMRVTPQRVAIAEYMRSTDTHPAVEEVHRAIRRQHPAVSLSTVYNTLELLRDQGLVCEIRMASGSRYDGRDKAHINLVCVNCGRIEDLDGPLVEALRSGIAAASDYAVNDCLDLRGRCGRCRAQDGV